MVEGAEKAEGAEGAEVGYMGLKGQSIHGFDPDEVALSKVL